MGTVSCNVCGVVFSPFSASSSGDTLCRSCGTLHPNNVGKPQSTGSGSSLLWREQGTVVQGSEMSSSSWALPLDGTIFSSLSLEAAEKAMHQRLHSLTSLTGKTAGVTEVDNRVLEETFCEHCGKHTLCRSFARQTRSADEGQTIFFQCSICRSEWQHNS